MISIEEFARIELKVGTVIEAEDIEGSEKLLKLKVDLGEEQPRQVLAGVKQWYKPEDLKGKQVIVVANLEPRMMMGLESQGMMLAASCDDKPIFLTVPREVSPGSKIR
ncbi:methionine--tRNA ligase subunit beta [Candidatus Daviesbacteria bacterium]|nr:methionine--tRNA ligase subunit beta [Candidatus Daviesbacteria bacterium]